MRPRRLTRRLASLLIVPLLVVAFVPLMAAPASAATITVNTVADDDTANGNCTLREAIIAANTDAARDQCPAGSGTDLIGFNISPVSSGDVHTISPTSALPIISSPLEINGYSESGAAENTAATGSNAVLQIELAGSNAASTIGLHIAATSGVTIRGLVVNRWGSTGILVDTTATSVVIAGNFIGTDASGVTDLGNTFVGVAVSGAGNTIGGTTLAARNVISGNDTVGVSLGSGASGNAVHGNLIGTNAAGTAALGNTQSGVLLTTGAGSNAIGGTAAGTGNVISGNGNRGVSIFGSTATPVSGNAVQGNRIGTNAAGTAPLPNALGGIEVFNGPDTTIGGTATTAGNLISGNNGQGVFVGPGSGGTAVLGNLVGTNAAGSGALGNGANGIQVGSADVTVGGIAAGARNVISANGGNGVLITLSSATGMIVQGNYIGTDATGTADLGNTNTGVLVSGGATGAVVGGSTTAARNVISGNGANGVAVSGASGAVVRGNFIGTNAAGTSPLGNTGSGVLIADASSNAVGGAGAGEANLIANNAGAGVAVTGSAASNAILANAIHSNGGLGIDLGADGVTANDGGAADDADTGPNGRLNFPVLASAHQGSTVVNGSLDTLPNTTFRVEFFGNASCDASGNGEGAELFGVRTLTTDASGVAAFSESFPATLPTGVVITATATRLSSGTPVETSEFSNCATVTDAPAASADLSLTKTDAPDPVAPGANITYTITVTNNGPDVAESVQLSDAVPADTTFVSFTAPAGWTVSTPAAGGTGTVTATTASLASSAVATFTLVVQVGGSVADGSTISNTASVSSSTTDPSGGNNAGTENTAVQAPVSGEADLGVTLSDRPDLVTEGDQYSYGAEVTNAGPDAATDTVLTVELPDEVAFDAAISGRGPCTQSDGVVTCQLGQLDPGTAARVQVVVTANAPGEVVADAEVGSPLFDPTSPNVDSETTTINPVPNGGSRTLTVSKTGKGSVKSQPEGISCGRDCVEVFGDGAVVKLRARPRTGWTFTGWGGECAHAGSNTLCTLVMDSDRHVTATFAV